jgi:mitotic spindle assembly checkpoint protein MAD2
MTIVSKETGEVLERWQFDVHIFGKHTSPNPQSAREDKENIG